MLEAPLMEADVEREVYLRAWNVAREELGRIDAAMRGKRGSEIPSLLRVRRVRVCQALAALEALSSETAAY